jgi:hypothetical protein
MEISCLVGAQTLGENHLILILCYSIWLALCTLLFCLLFRANKILLVGFSLACLVVAWLGTRDRPKLEDFTIELLIALRGRAIFVGIVSLCLTAGINIWALLLLILKFWFVSFSLWSSISSMSFV